MNRTKQHKCPKRLAFINMGYCARFVPKMNDTYIEPLMGLPTLESFRESFRESLWEGFRGGRPKNGGPVGQVKGESKED